MLGSGCDAEVGNPALVGRENAPVGLKVLFTSLMVLKRRPPSPEGASPRRLRF